MWIKSYDADLIAYVTNPEHVPDGCEAAWRSGFVYFRLVDVRYGFKFPEEWKGLESWKCFRKGNTDWRGLKVKFVPERNEFVTI